MEKLMKFAITGDLDNNQCKANPNAAGIKVVAFAGFLKRHCKL